MALIKCPECSRDISDKAEACPHCGLPLSKAIHRVSPFKTVSCLDCKKEFDYDAEVCPHCGLFNSQKYKDSNDFKPEHINTYPSKPSISDNNNADFITNFFVSILIAVISGFVLNSVLVGFMSFIVFFIVMYRVNYLAKHPGKKLKYERHIYTWKGILGYCIVIIVIAFVQNSIKDHAEKIKKEQEQQKITKSYTIHLKQAKLLIDKFPNLSDEEWLSAYNHLSSIPQNAAEYPEAQKLLPVASSNKKGIEVRRQEAKKKEEQLAEIKRIQQETAGLTAEGKRLKQKHPEWSVEDCDTISKGKIHIGMTEGQVAAAWGRPYHINNTHGSYGTHSQWVMHEMGNSYVYFEDGICTAIQN